MSRKLYKGKIDSLIINGADTSGYQHSILNKKATTIKLLEENTGVNLNELALGKGF